MLNTTAAARGAALLLTGMLMLGELSGCSDSSSPATPAASASPTPVAEAAITPGDAVPAPSGKVVLTLRGVPNTNVGRTLQFDLATLEQLGTVSYAVDDRQALGRTVTFSGPLLRTVLEVAGAEGSTVHAVALNDYAVDIPVSDATEMPVMLATRADGEEMSVEDYGPTRVIYPDSLVDLDPALYDPRWIWQLRTIEVR